MASLGMAGGESFGDAAAALEFILEGLYLIRRLSKDTEGGTSVPDIAKWSNYRYGRYVDGPDPLALSYDVRAALDEMGDAILAAPTRPTRCGTCSAGARPTGGAWTT